MSKKLILSCMAVVAFAAFVLPAGASAKNTPTLRDAEGVVKVGSKIWGTNVGVTAFYNTATTITQVTCTTAHMTGEVTENGTDTVEAKITTADFQGTGGKHADNNLPECTTAFGSGAAITVTNMPLIIRSTAAMATHEFQVTGTGGKVTFDIIDTAAGTCRYELTNAAVIGHYTTGSAASPSTLTTTDTAVGSGAALEPGGGFLCPTSGVLKMTFNLETDGGNNGPVWITET